MTPSGIHRAQRWTTAYTLLLAFAIGVIVACVVAPFVVSGAPTASLALEKALPTSPDVSTPGVGRAGPSDGAGGAAVPGATGAAPSGSPALGTPGASAGGPIGEQSDAATTGGGRPALTASDVGVSATTIKLGVTVIDTSKTEALGLSPAGYTTQGQEDYANAQLDAINQAGGINGRQVKAEFAIIDPTNGSTQNTACTHLTEDVKVFAVIGSGLGDDGLKCLAQQHATPVFAPGASASTFAAGRGLVATAGPTTSRIFMNWADALARLGHLDNTTVGILSDASKDADVSAALVPALRAAGHEPFVYSLSSDIQTASSQIPIAVQQMRSHKVDALLVPTAFLYLDQFTREAEHQLYTPQYHVSDVNGLTLSPLVAQTGDSFDKAIGITFGRGNDAASGVPEQPGARKCREAYNSYAHASISYGTGDPFAQACQGVAVFASAAHAAGPTLTRGGYAQALQSLGSFNLPGVYGGHFAPGKADYADLLRPLLYSKGCHCWKDVGSVSRGKY